MIATLPMPGQAAISQGRFWLGIGSSCVPVGSAAGV
jgi:hypothetical protein